MNKRLIIGLIGPKGSGKDYAYSILFKHFDNVDRVAFADPIKNTICELFSLRPDQLELLKRCSLIDFINHNTSQNYGSCIGRDFVRNIGMLMRNYDDQQFNRYVENKIKDNPNTTWVVTDVRFPNEVELIKRLGGVLIEIHREGYAYDHHVTESGELPHDHLVVNDENFEDNLVKLINQLMEEHNGDVGTNQR